MTVKDKDKKLNIENEVMIKVKETKVTSASHIGTSNTRSNQNGNNYNPRKTS